MKYFLLACSLWFCCNVQAQQRLNMDSLFNWQDADLVPSSAHNNTYNEIWGYARNGSEYAIIGSTAGTHIIDVTVPATAHQVAFIAGAFSGSAVVHRDFHDYDDYLYIVCDEGPSTLQIVDLRQLPDTVIVVYDSDALFARSHNIFIDSSSARMYMCGGTKEFAVYSLADPVAPTLLVDCPVDIPFWGSIGYVHDVYVRNDTAFCNAGMRGLFIVDFSNIAEPLMIGSLSTYVQSGYNHSGWLMPHAPYYALADETHGMDIKIIDVSDLSDLEVTDTIGSNVDRNSIVHNVIYANGFLFASFYFDGVYMFDCTDPAHPTLAGFYDTSTEQHQAGRYRGCWGVYPFLPSGNVLASDMQTGLWVLGHHMVAGIEENKATANTFSVYPNPATDQLSVPSELRGMPFSIIDMMGRQIKHGTVSGSIDVSDLTSGVFMLTVQQEGAFSGVKFLKQ